MNFVAFANRVPLSLIGFENFRRETMRLIAGIGIDMRLLGRRDGPAIERGAGRAALRASVERLPDYLDTSAFIKLVRSERESVACPRYRPCAAISPA